VAARPVLETNVFLEILGQSHVLTRTDLPIETVDDVDTVALELIGRF
jgi:hypothetical protein